MVEYVLQGTFKIDKEDDEGKHYEVCLALEILNGLRESTVPETPIEYAKLYNECWDSGPEKRPLMNEVVERLRMISQSNNTFDYHQIKRFDDITDRSSSSIENTSNNAHSQGDIYNIAHSQGDMSKMMMGEMNSSDLAKYDDKISSNRDEIILSDNLEISSKKDLNEKIDDIVQFIYNGLNEGKIFTLIEKPVLNFIINQGFDLQEIYNWISNNQNNSNNLFLLGYFNFFGIKSSKNYDKAFDSFNKASEDHTLAQCYVGKCYEKGYGVAKDKRLASDYYKRIADKNFTTGQVYIGYFYRNGIGVNRDFKMAVHWYKKAAENGNIHAIYNLGNSYKNGKGVEENYDKAFELLKKSAEQGNNFAQNELAILYENGDGIEKDIDQAIYWYEKSAKQDNLEAKNKLRKLLKPKNKKKWSDSCKIN
ncbi:6429_t:CDS:2 [Funneliformis geosporum]|uniref:6429_t:CDS:1 n=1 Tax=Funneliformis geosporum TaxID=1117311 RepID=A0A9W4SFT0_9GLOM|nr:6429_t:CDS:2 [Funneliformis geosporum]